MRITLEPENRQVLLPKVSTVTGLLNKLGLKSNQALVIRNNELLTPDEKIYPDDAIIVRQVASRG